MFNVGDDHIDGDVDHGVDDGVTDLDDAYVGDDIFDDGVEVDVDGI